MTARSLHRALSAVLLAFVPLHLIGHLAGLGGQGAFDRVQAMLRPFYRNPVAEPVLIAALLAQAGLGLWLLWQRGRKGWRPGMMRWQSLSGLVVALFVLQHIPAMLAARQWAGLDTTYWWPASVASTLPFAVYFWPYYLAGVAGFCLHLGIGLSMVLRRRGRALAARRVVAASVGIGLVLGLAILAGISGQIHPVTLPPDWQGYLAALWPFSL